ncbi:Zn-finger in Ran binding protein [Trichuris suis]|nr:Zn-finger in Ran binding protein [Trichuris suis]
MSTSYSWSPPEKRKRNDSSWLQTLRAGVGMSAFSGLRSFFEALTAPFSPTKSDSSTSDQSTSGLPCESPIPESSFHFGSSRLNSATLPSSFRCRLGITSAKTFLKLTTTGDRLAQHHAYHRLDFLHRIRNYHTMCLSHKIMFKLFNHQEATPVSKISKTAGDFAQPIRRRPNIHAVSFPIPERHKVMAVSSPISERNESLPLQRHPSSKKPIERSLERSTPSAISAKSQSFAGKMSDPFNFNVPWSVDFSSVKTNEKKRLSYGASPHGSDDEQRQNHWICSLCSHINHPFRRRCTHCLNSRKGVCMTDYWKCQKCCYRNAIALDECLLCRTPKVVPRKSTEDESLGSPKKLPPEQKRWQCGVCLLSNTPERLRCIGCATLRGVYDMTARHSELNSTLFDQAGSSVETSMPSKSSAFATPTLADEKSKSDDILHPPSVAEEEDLSEELSAASDSNEANEPDEQNLKEGESVKRLINCLFECEIIDLCSDSDGEHNVADEASREPSETSNFSNYSEKSQVCSKAGDSSSPIVTQPEDEELKRSEVCSSNGAAVAEKRSDANAVLVQPSLQALVAGPSTWLFPPQQSASSVLAAPTKESQNLPSSPEGSKDEGIASATPSTASAYDVGVSKGFEQPDLSAPNSTSEPEKVPTSEGPTSGVSVEVTSQPTDDTARELSIDASGNSALSIEEQAEVEKVNEAPRTDLSPIEAMVESPSEPSSTGGTELTKMPTVEEPQKASEPFQFVQQSGSRVFNFGQPLPTSSPFGFGQTSAAPSLFGSSSLTKTTSSASPFNFGLSTTSSSFGSQTSEASGATKTLFSNFGQQPMNTSEDKTSKLFGQGTVSGKGFCFSQSSAQSFSSNTATSVASVLGTTTSTTSIFGTPTTTASIFAAAVPTAPVFGSATPTTSATSLFNAATPVASVFGSPATSASPFGTPTSTTSIFGSSLTSQAQNESLFAQNALKQNVFNFGQKPAFGTTPFQSTSLLATKQGDQPATTAASGFNFGDAAPFAASSSTGSSSSLFASWGGKSLATSTAPSIFKFGQTAAPPTFPWVSQMASSSSAPSFGSSSLFVFGSNPAKSGDHFTAGQTGEAKDSSSATQITGVGPTGSGPLPSAPTIFNAAGLNQAQSGTAASGRRMIHARRRVRRC